MEHVLLHLSLDALKHNPVPYTVFGVGFAFVCLWLYDEIREEHKDRGARILLALAVLAVLWFGVGEWAKSATTDYCRSVRGDIDWDTHHCDVFDPRGHGLTLPAGASLRTRTSAIPDAARRA
jgi:hypothetical protein